MRCTNLTLLRNLLMSIAAGLDWYQRGARWYSTTPAACRNAHTHTQRQQGMYLCLEALLCHVSQAGLVLQQEGFTPALQMLTGEGSGLQDERHTARTRPHFEQQRNSMYIATTRVMPSAAEVQHWKPDWAKLAQVGPGWVASCHCLGQAVLQLAVCMVDMPTTGIFIFTFVFSLGTSSIG